MGGPRDGRQRFAAPTEQLVGAAAPLQAGATAYHEQRRLEAGEQSGRRLKAVGARPVKHIYCRCLDRLGAQSGGQAAKLPAPA